VAPRVTERLTAGGRMRAFDRLRWASEFAGAGVLRRIHSDAFPSSARKAESGANLPLCVRRGGAEKAGFSHRRKSFCYLQRSQTCGTLRGSLLDVLYLQFSTAGSETGGAVKRLRSRLRYRCCRGSNAYYRAAVRCRLKHLPALLRSLSLAAWHCKTLYMRSAGFCRCGSPFYCALPAFLRCWLCGALRSPPVQRQNLLLYRFVGSPSPRGAAGETSGCMRQPAIRTTTAACSQPSNTHHLRYGAGGFLLAHSSTRIAAR